MCICSGSWWAVAVTWKTNPSADEIQLNLLRAVNEKEVKTSSRMDSCFEWLSCLFLILFPLSLAFPTTSLQIQFTSYCRAQVLVCLLLIFLCSTKSNWFDINFLVSWFNCFRPNFSVGYSTQHLPNSPCLFFCAFLVTLLSSFPSFRLSTLLSHSLFSVSHSTHPPSSVLPLPHTVTPRSPLMA